MSVLDSIEPNGSNVLTVTQSAFFSLEVSVAIIDAAP